MHAQRSYLKQRRSTALSSVVLLLLSLVAVFVMPGSHALAANIVTYPQIPGVNVSGVFSVQVNGQNSPAYIASGSPTSTFTTFATDGAVTVGVRDLQGSVSSAVVRPKSYGIVPTIQNGNTVEFTINPDQKVSVEVNGDTSNNVALIFADSPETNVPTGSNVLAYTTPGVYDLGSSAWCFPNGVDTLYIAGGVYLKGVISCPNDPGHRVNILGRGILSGEGHSIPIEYTGSVYINGSTTMDGISLIDAAQDCCGQGYALSLGSNTTVNDIALINYPDVHSGGNNHTGVAVGSNSTVSNDFVVAGDDAVIVSDGMNNSNYTNLVLWTTGGDALELGWNAGGYGDTVDGVDIIHYGGGNYGGTQAAIGAIGYCNTVDHPIHDVTVKNVRVEGALNRLIGIAAQNAGFCNVNPTEAPIYNIAFSNITAEQNGANSNVIFGSNSSATVSNVSFQNLTIAGQQITNAAQGNFSIGSYTSNITFNGNTTGLFQGAPAAISTQAGSLDVFVRGNDNKLWQRWYRNGSWSSSWATQGSPNGGLAGSPAVASLDGNLTVFGRGSDGALWQISWTGSGWSNWTSLGGPTNNTFQGTPTAVSTQSGYLDVFVRGTDNNLWQRWYRNGSWSSGWATQGSPNGGLADSLAVASLNGNLTVFGHGSDGALWQISWAGTGWSNWTSLGGPTGGTFVGAPSAIGGSGNLDVFVRGTDNNVWQRWYRNGSWSSGWATQGSPNGGLADSPAVASLDGNGTVFVRAADGALWQISWMGSGWSSWASLGGPT